MIQTVSSTLLLYPEWIIFITIGVSILCLVFVAHIWYVCEEIRSVLVGESSRLTEENARIREEHARLRRDHEARRDAYVEFAAEHERLRRKYDELWREHQETCDLLGPLLSDDTAS